MGIWNRQRKRDIPTHGSRRPKHGPDAPEWARRTSQILELAEQNPIIRQHVEPFFPDGSTAASRRLRRLSQQRRLRIAGTVLLNAEGRPNHVYCNGWTPKPAELRHDVLTTDIVLCYPEATVRRGPFTQFKNLRADAELQFPDGRLFWVELDTGSEGLAKVRKRFRTYRQHHTDNGILLFVTLSPVRLTHLLDEASIVSGFSVFATYADVMANPRGPVWTDVDGNVGTIN